MTNTKTTKRALLSSVLALVICVAMLIGSTFAWFTDSVTSGKNIIQAGNLKISATVHDLDQWYNGFDEENQVTSSFVTLLTYDFMKKGDLDEGITLGFPETGVDFESEAGFMSDSLFEPGKTYVKMIRVKNDGNLAAKIKLHFDIENSELEDALWFAISTDGDQIDRMEMSKLNEKLDGIEISVPTYGKACTDIIFAYGMNEEAGNTYQGKAFSGTFNILATQDTYETDSFGKDYDAGAEYPLADSIEALGDLLAAAAPGDTVALGSAIVGGTIEIPEGLDDVTILSVGAQIDQINVMQDVGAITLSGFKFSATDSGDNFIVTSNSADIGSITVANSVFTGTGGKTVRGVSGGNKNTELVFENCTFKDMGYPIYDSFSGYKSIIVKNCTFSNIQSWAVMAQGAIEEVVIDNCTFNNCSGGLAKLSGAVENAAFTFTNNTLTDCVGHDGRGWAELPTNKLVTVTCTGNTLNGEAFNPFA